MKLLAAAFAVASATDSMQKIAESMAEHYKTLSRREQREFCDEKKWPGGLPDVCTITKGDGLEGQLMLFSNARNYGCWCDLDDAQRRQSKGQPVNALDQACRDLQHAYDCISIDMGNCNARTANVTDDYVLPLTAISPIMNPKQQCQQYNKGNTCGMRICQVEAEFLRVTYQPVYAGDNYWLDMWTDMNLVHQANGGSFNYENECQKSGGGNPCSTPGACTNQPQPAGDRKCCGIYPYRTAYWTGRNKCCNGAISSPDTC